MDSCKDLSFFINNQQSIYRSLCSPLMTHKREGAGMMNVENKAYETVTASPHKSVELFAISRVKYRSTLFKIKTQ